MSKIARIKPFGDQAFLIEWSNEISEYNHAEVSIINNLIKQKFGEFIIETTPSYQSLAIYLKKNINTSFLIESIYKLLGDGRNNEKVKSSIYYIPVCYKKEFGLDLESLSVFHNLSVECIISQHTKPLYPVYFIGFLPGFPYLEGLNPLLATPRKEKPRSIVHAGSVGIAGKQTGVYPMDSPGGWNIIGRTPISFFNIYDNSPSLLKAGDLVKFESISISEFYEIEKAVENKSYQIKKTDSA